VVELGAELPDDCYRCGYNLRGIADDHPCPECGLLAQRSRRPSDELHHTRPQWLRKIAWGTNLILFSIVLICVAPFVMDQIDSFVISNMGWGWTFYRYLMLANVVVPALMFWIGLFLLTSREGYPPADRVARPWAIALRTASLTPIAMIGLQIWIEQFGRPLPRQWVNVIELTLAYLGLVPLPFLLFYYLRQLAHRARSAQLAEHCLIVGCGGSFCILFPVLFVMTDGFFSKGDNLGGMAGALLIAFIISTYILFILWSAYLFIRFAISFNKAARQLRREWKRDDRAESAVS
jgi:hypothetical protein